jgi:protein-tyrosine phosphatase
MIDLHHHLLPATDDGSKDLATSVAMVEMAVDDGITHIVATPHANHTYHYDRPAHERLLQQIREALPSATAARVQLGLGCDFHLSVDNIDDARAHPRRYTINETEYLLVELPDFNIPPRLDEVFYAMRVDGLTPILTHPERNSTLQRTPERLQEWLRAGLLVQVTAGSLSGNFGGKATKMAWDLLESGSVHVLATDAHNLSRRPPKMSQARGLIAKKFGEEVAELLCMDNPLAIVEGKPLPAQHSLEALRDNANAAARPFWKRLFGKD